MLQMNRSITTQRRLLLFKWLMIFTPPVTVMVGYNLLGHAVGHSLLGVTVDRLAVNLLVALLLLVLVYILAETLFGVLGSLQAEVVAREQDLQTMNAVMQEREKSILAKLHLRNRHQAAAYGVARGWLPRLRRPS